MTAPKSERAEMEANARLIAAAPEMAQLLAQFVALEWDDGRSLEPSVRVKARALLARIRGEAP